MITRKNWLFLLQELVSDFSEEKNVEIARNDFFILYLYGLFDNFDIVPIGKINKSFDGNKPPEFGQSWLFPLPKPLKFVFLFLAEGGKINNWPC